MTNHAKVAGYFPEAYSGQVIRGNKEMTIIEVATLDELPPIFVRHGDWVVTPEGLNCLTSHYEIPLERLDENDWLRHMEEKPWVKIEDFRRALWDAQEMVKLGILHLHEVTQG